MGAFTHCAHCGIQIGFLYTLRQQLLKPVVRGSYASARFYYKQVSSQNSIVHPPSSAIDQTPFIFCNTPIIRSWDGRSCVNPQLTATTSKIDRTTPTWIDKTTPTAIKGYNETVFLLKDLMTNGQETPMSESRPTGEEFNDKAPVGHLSFVLFKLREELPHFLSSDHSYQLLYDKNVLLENKLLGINLSIRGLSKYKWCLTSLKRFVCCLYRNATLELMKITKNPDKSIIEARWRIRGLPRYMSPWNNSRIVVEGFSTFKVNKAGQISIHTIDNMMPLPKNTVWVLTYMARLRSFALKPALPTTTTSTIASL